MIYIISGYMRTGTSMMMQALERGGMEAVHNTARSAKMLARHGDEHYSPNSAGLYELSRSQYLAPGFPSMHDGKLIKILMPAICRIVAAQYRMVFMLRDPVEVCESYNAFFLTKLGPPLSGETYSRVSQEMIDILKMRRDVDLIVLNYRDVLDAPLRAFEALREQGWPINPSDAAAIVDIKQYRHRRESLDA